MLIGVERRSLKRIMTKTLVLGSLLGLGLINNYNIEISIGSPLNHD